MPSRQEVTVRPLLEGVEFVDFLTALRDHAGERTWEGIFYRTDHHWTTLGAYYGYAALMEALGRGGEVPEPETVRARDLPVSNGFQGTLYSQSGISRTRFRSVMKLGTL